jgi:DNA-binding NtrC family response regulator
MAAGGFLVHARYLPGPILGRGAQGVVGRVVDREAPDRELVAKVWRPGVFREEALVGEFALLARLRVPGVVRAHDLGRDERSGAPFFVEELVPGDDAATWVGAAPVADRAGRLVSVLRDVARALAALHGAGFLHSDLKPAHVRMRPGGSGEEAVLLDLGASVARAKTPAGPAAFTAGFAAPELLAGSAPSTASDLFGLGALGWALAAGAPPASVGQARGRLRDTAPWVKPSVAELIEALLEPHPADRPSSALEILGALGAATAEAGIGLGALAAPIGRERELHELLSSQAGSVRYITGPGGAGKSHLARELVTRALCSGRSARHLEFPREADPVLPGLIGLLRDSSGRGRFWPFSTPPDDRRPLLVVLDDLELAPAEVRAALDAYRCRPDRLAALEIVATARSAPDGADSIELGPLSEESFRSLCCALGVEDPEEAAIASGKSPGWLVASLGRVPLTQSTAFERVRELSSGARELLTAIAIADGALPESTLRIFCPTASRNLGELFAASLVTRRDGPEGALYSLTARQLAKDLASALATPAIADRVAGALLEDAAAPVSALLRAASLSNPSVVRGNLLEKAADQAMRRGLRTEEIEARIELCAEAHRRTPELLYRLERLTRDAGASAAYPQVLEWLTEAGERDEKVRVLSLRRRAEKLARDGDAAAAEALAAEAVERARAMGDTAAEAFSLATLGLVALMRASFPEAERRLSEARARLSGMELDQEEIARLHHNAGVVALYRGDVEDAIATFERSLSVKRSLGDRAGMRSCLMNLGIALGKAGRYAEAYRALEEALRLARSLGQVAGRGWCFSALADIEVRRGRAREAERWIAEAEALASALPAAIRADLVIARANVALMDGDGARALAALQSLEEAVSASDPLVFARARIAEASAHLALLPASPRRAARLAIEAARRARAAKLDEPVSQALEVLRSARRGPGYSSVEGLGRTPMRDEGALWAWLAEAVSAGDPDRAGIGLARAVGAESGAERALIASVSASGEILSAWGADLDGLPVAEAAQRIAPDLLEAALGQSTPIYRRDEATVGGRGSRLAVRSPGGVRAVVVVEHRFRPGCFDAVTPDQASRWATLAALFLRLFALENRALEPAAPLPSPAEPGPAATTVLPTSEPTRAFPGILGRSSALRRALAELDRAVDSDLPVLITGETGTGKELFARALHELGPRRRRELVTINCGAVPDALFEAELYGHARGAFTGAERARPGLLARAEGGTLFLDELGELPLARQAALLRALEVRRYRPVGSDEERPFDVRIVAATNRDLEQAAAAKTFRQDLLFRVNAITIHVPPLRARDGDVPLLTRAFLDRSGAPPVISEAALDALDAYDWPGNVRELEHVIQRLVALGGRRIEVQHLPRAIRRQILAEEAAPSGERRPREEPASDAPPTTPIQTQKPRRSEALSKSRDGTEDDEREAIRIALAATGGNISHAAERLGITRHGLKKRMVRLGMRAAAGALPKVS